MLSEANPRSEVTDVPRLITENLETTFCIREHKALLSTKTHEQLQKYDDWYEFDSKTLDISGNSLVAAFSSNREIDSRYWKFANFWIGPSPEFPEPRLSSPWCNINVPVSKTGIQLRNMAIKCARVIN